MVRRAIAAVILAVVFQPLLPIVITFGGLSIAFLIFASIGVSALGVLAVLGMWKLSQLFFQATGKYVQFNLQIIKKQEARA